MVHLSTLLVFCCLFIVVAQTSMANPLFGGVIRKALDGAERSVDDAAELALRSGRSAAATGAEQAVRQQVDIEDLAKLLKGSPPDVRRSALLNANPNLLIDNPKLATALGLEEVLRANPRILKEILPSQSQVEFWTSEQIVMRYANIASKEAAKPSPAFRLDIGTGKLTLIEPVRFGGIEYTGIKLNLYHATGVLAGACVVYETCRAAVIDLGAMALLEAAANLED